MSAGDGVLSGLSRELEWPQITKLITRYDEFSFDNPLRSSASVSKAMSRHAILPPLHLVDLRDHRLSIPLFFGRDLLDTYSPQGTYSCLLTRFIDMKFVWLAIDAQIKVIAHLTDINWFPRKQVLQ